jgi:hypothetical protein
MRASARKFFPATILAGIGCGAAVAADLSTVGRWIDKNPSDKLGENYFVRSQKEMHGPKIRWPAMERVFSPHGRAIPMIAAAIR